MSTITHHVPDATLACYAAGNLPHAFAVVVASHVSLCIQCRAALEAHQHVGGALLEAADAVAVSADLKSAVLSRLDEPFMPEPVYERSGIYPGPVMEVLKGRAPNWKSIGMGVRQDILSSGKEGSVRLLFIPPSQAVPDHSHNGLEMTLVLQGSFHDQTGGFGVGDIEIASQDMEHAPVAGKGEPCICLAATDARLRFRALFPRLLQPLFRI